LRIYLECRHGMANESNREEVMADAITWFDKVLAGAA
jgi:alpha-beta hydrolase superfamily lysophospholipase